MVTLPCIGYIRAHTLHSTTLLLIIFLFFLFLCFHVTFQAAINGRSECLVALLNAGADVNATDHGGYVGVSQCHSITLSEHRLVSSWHGDASEYVSG